MPDQEFEEALKSKSQLKRDMHALQKVGEQLVALKEKELLQYNLPEILLNAIIAAQTIKQHGAKKRQLQYIGKLMREIDAQPIIAKLEERQLQFQRDNRHFKQIEIWRDKLLNEGDAALGELSVIQPKIDKQQIRSLVRNAKSQAEAGKPPKAARALFQYLKSVIE